MKWPMAEIYTYLDMTRGHSSHYGVSIMDIDYFTRFCLRFTNTEIDDVINNIYLFLRKEIPAGAGLWKSNGDEFMAVCPGMTKSELALYISNVKKRFKKEKFARNCSKEYSNITITFSAGIASSADDGDDIDELIRRAVVSLFIAKANRRDKVYKAPDIYANIKGMDRKLFCPDLNIEVVVGDYGETGTVKYSLALPDVRLWEPQAIDLDEFGNLYIADQNNNYILKCDDTRAYRIAGNGSFGYNGDGGIGMNALLNRPTGLAVYGSILYITDTGNDVVRRLDMKTGIIDTFAGNGEPGYTGDGGPAVEARLNKPGGATVDCEGNLFINDVANNVVRRVDRDGIITSYAGNGEYGYSGDGGPAVQAAFAEIYGICSGKNCGDLYIADYFNHCIRKVCGKTHEITTIIGTGRKGYSGDGCNPLTACLNLPVAVCRDEYGNLFIAESGNSCIRISTARSSMLYTLVGDGIYGIGEGGDISKFRLANPNGIAVDKENRLYILDGANNRVCCLNLNNIGGVFR